MAATLKLTRKWGGLLFANSGFDISIDGAVVGSIRVKWACPGLTDTFLSSAALADPSGR